MADFNEILQKTFHLEGGFQNDPKDTGNICGGKVIGTNRGISAIAYSAYIGRCSSVAEVQAITPEIAGKVYKKLFWDKLRGDDINNQSVAHIFFDAYIQSGNNGLKRNRKYINKYYGKNVVGEGSGSFGNNEVKYINNANAKKLFDIAHAGEVDFRKYLATSNPAKYEHDLAGWLSRLNQITFEFVKKNPVTTAIGFVVLGLVGFTAWYYWKNRNELRLVA